MLPFGEGNVGKQQAQRQPYWIWVFAEEEQPTLKAGPMEFPSDRAAVDYARSLMAQHLVAVWTEGRPVALLYPQ